MERWQCHSDLRLVHAFLYEFENSLCLSILSGLENSFCFFRTSSISPRQPGVTNADTRSDAASVDNAAPVDNVDAAAAHVNNVDAAPVNHAATVDNVDADAAPVNHVDATPANHADAAPVTQFQSSVTVKRLISKPQTTGIKQRLILCKKCKEYSKYSSAGSVRVNPKTKKETVSIRAVCGICIHPVKGGPLCHERWLVVVDKPTADAAPVDSLTTSQLLSSEDDSLFHVQPAYYSRNHCAHVVDPANLATIPNASLGSLNQGELWPTGIQATAMAPAVVTGVYCTDTRDRGIAHCMTYHADVLPKDPHFVVYEIKPSHPEYNNFLNTNIVGFFKCMAVVDISLAMSNLGHVVITHI